MSDTGCLIGDGDVSARDNCAGFISDRTLDPGSKLCDRRNGKQKSNRQPYCGEDQNATEMTHGNLRNTQNVWAPRRRRWKRPE